MISVALRMKSLQTYPGQDLRSFRWRGQPQ